MDAASTPDTPLPGYPVPIKAPLTIDSDSELDLPINTHSYSRTSSFNSSCSSIDISSYGDEHTSIFEAYPDEEIVIERSHVEKSLNIRPFVRYPDANLVKKSCDDSDSTIVRPFVKVPCAESGSGDIGNKLNAPIAPLTRDCDSDSDTNSDYIDGCRDSGWIPAMAPKVGSFNGDELQIEGVFSGDDITGIENLNFVATESAETEGCKVECLTEVMKVSESDASSFDLERNDAQIVSNSDSEIENPNPVSTESVKNEGCKVECFNEIVELCESDALSFDLERIDAQVVLNSDSEIENPNPVSTESVANEGCKAECFNEVVKLCEPDALSFDLERIGAQIVSNSDSKIENLNSVATESVENEGCKVECSNEVLKLIVSDVTKLLESDEPSFELERFDAHIVSHSDSEIEYSNSLAIESLENKGCNVEYLNEVSESDATGFDLERIKARTMSTSNNEIEIVTKLSESDEPSIDSEIIDTHIVSNSEGEQMLTKMQRVRTKFLRLALNQQLTTEVNQKGGNYNFDFDLTVLAIGKTGVGKSATINSIFGENKAITSAFDPGTTTIQEYTGSVDGIQLRVIDTPGLKCSSSDRSYNIKVLNSIKRFTRKHAPNVVLYVDRLDTRDVNDLDILSLITSSLGSSVWDSCIIALTHASCDLSRGSVVRRCRFIQERIVSYGGYNRRVANPVWLVDNHPSYKHDVMDLSCGITGLVCLDQVNEDEGCDQVQPFEAVSMARDIINSGRERRDAYFAENSYYVKLVGNNYWSLGCRLFM